MKLQRISLDGAWDFQIDAHDGSDVAAIATWRSIAVPGPWQAQFDDLREWSGTAWYRRRFDVGLHSGEDLAHHAAILHFGAVDYHTTVWVNGDIAGENEGGYLPFEFDITSFLRPGENEIVVRVVDASDDRSRYPAYPFSEVPHGKQSWYGPIGGIWQSVWLEIRPRLHIRGVRLVPNVAERTIRVEASLSAPLPSNAELQVTVRDAAGNSVAVATLDADGAGVARLAGKPQLWGPGTPHLYSAETVLLEEGQEVHRLVDSCGFRTVEARDGRIYLNGEPIYLRSALDQGYFPETIYTPPSLAMIEDQARKAIALGLNSLRIHIKIEDPRYYEVADRLGLIIWTEIPNWALLTDETDRRARETFRGMVERDGNHPSILIWTLINENWGTDLPRNPEHRRWLRDFYVWARTVDPTRLIVDNSACCDNMHVAGDLEDFHHYRTLPDHAAEWDTWVTDFASRQNDWVWASDHLSERRPDLPLLVSEFGNWGLPDPATIHEHGREPWWFETGHSWGDGIVYPHGAEQRFADCGLAGLYASYADFARASQGHMARSLHYEITSMRLHDSIAGYVITELTDVHWECNGLLTMPRAVKHGLEPWLTSVNQDRVVLLRPAKWSVRPGETVEVEVRTAGPSGQEGGGVVRWQMGAQTGELAAPGGTIRPAVDEAGVAVLHAQWMTDDGSTIAANQVEIACMAPLAATASLHVVGDADLARVLADLGHPVTQGALPDVGTAIVVARRYTLSLQDYVQRGGRVLFLAGGAPAGSVADGDPEVRIPVGAIVPREGTAWQGDWANSFTWLRKEGPLAHIPGDPLLEMESAAIRADAVITGMPPWLLLDHSWAGIAIGWIHKTASLLLAHPYGRGHFAVTTLRMDATTLASNAMAQAVFSGILRMV